MKAIQVEGLSKRFQIGKLKGHSTMRDALAAAAKAPFRRRNPEDETILWALRDVSFSMEQGEVLGLIGRNGAGKSTLLKILARITRPTSGYAKVHGRIGSLLEVGTGFHHELSGRENIFLSGAVLGMKKAEIAKKFDEIVGFSEVERFLDTPLKHYSSGMQMRLAFAVAAHLEPETLLVDEVLAVGDAAFQRKCMGKMQDVARHGRTILFVSHNNAAISSLCGSALLLERGRVGLYSRNVSEVLKQYAGPTTLAETVDLRHHPNRISRTAVFESISLLDLDRGPTHAFLPGATAEINLCLNPPDRIRSPRLSIGFTNPRGERAFAIGTHIEGTRIDSIEGRTVVCVRFVVPPLLPGQYTLDIGFYDRTVAPLDEIIGGAALEVLTDSGLPGLEVYSVHMGHVLVRSEWRSFQNHKELVS